MRTGTITTLHCTGCTVHVMHFPTPYWCCSSFAPMSCLCCYFYALVIYLFSNSNFTQDYSFTAVFHSRCTCRLNHFLTQNVLKQADAVPLRAPCTCMCVIPVHATAVVLHHWKIYYGISPLIHCGNQFTLCFCCKFVHVIDFLLFLPCLLCDHLCCCSSVCAMSTLVCNIVGVFFLCLKSCFSIATATLVSNFRHC